MSWKCNKLQDQIIEQAFGELEPESARAVEEHAAGCPRCRDALDSYRRTASALNLLPEPPEPSLGVERLRRAILSAEFGSIRQPISVRLAAAGAALGALATWAVVSLTGGAGSPVAATSGPREIVASFTVPPVSPDALPEPHVWVPELLPAYTPHAEAVQARPAGRAASPGQGVKASSSNSVVGDGVPRKVVAKPPVTVSPRKSPGVIVIEPGGAAAREMRSSDGLAIGG